jgi:hypothetical protein
VKDLWINELPDGIVYSIACYYRDKQKKSAIKIIGSTFSHKHLIEFLAVYYKKGTFMSITKKVSTSTDIYIS